MLRIMNYFGHVLSGYLLSLCLFTDQTCAYGLHMENAGKLHLARYNDSAKPSLGNHLKCEEIVVAYGRWTFTVGSMIIRVWEVATYERWSHKEVRPQGSTVHSIQFF